MKKKYFLLLGLAGILMSTTTSCIDEVTPTDRATDESLTSSSKALESMVWAMPATMTKFNSLGYTSGNELHFDFGYPSIMRITDLFTADMPISQSSYDNFSSWERNKYQGPDYTIAGFLWSYLRVPILAANKVIGNIDEETANDTQLGFLAAAHAFRAMVYLTEAQLYEYLPCDVTDSITNAGNNLVGLTVPIVTESTTEEEAHNNPRVTHEVMSDFLLNDLQIAEKYIDKLTLNSKTLPDLSAVYGLYARLYMWNKDYANAEKYARKAIDLGTHTPLTKDQWLNTSTGFNTLSTSSWMWGAENVKEDDCVQSGIINWVSMMANETEFSYCSAGVYVNIDGKLYSQISDNDFRKLSFKAPEGSALSGQEPYIDEDIFESLPDYASLKFRPADGNTSSYDVACAVGIPLMRIEEMYLIEAEAAAHQNPAKGKQLLESFMTTYRDAKYTTNASSEEDVVDAVFLQKRIEFFGEGVIMYDYKRLNKSVDRAYPDTEEYTNNWKAQTRFQTNGRPAWMNVVMVRTERQNNTAIVGFENPDPSDLYESKD
jgi:tetratricopeptide (TPR) repeat protein